MNTQLTTQRPAHEILEIIGFLVPFPSVLIAAIVVLGSLSVARGQSYSYTIVAQTGQNGIASISGAPSINNSGHCVFPAQLSSGPAIFVGNGSAAPVNITPNLSVSSRTLGSFVQINDSDVVVAEDQYSGTTPDSYLIRTWAVNGPGITRSLLKMHLVALVEDASINNNGQVAYLGRNGSSTYTLYTTNTAGPEFYYTANLGNINGNFYFNPMIADNGSIVAKYELGSSTSGSIRAYNSTLQSYVVVAAVGDANQFDSLDELPGISPNGMAVAFKGSTPQGSGIYVAIADNTGSFSSSVPFLIAGAANGFSGFQSFSRVAVNARSVTVGTNSWLAVNVAYIGTQNGSQGLYVGSCLSLGPTNAPFVAPPTLVVSNGQTISGLDGIVKSIAIQNAPNTNGMIACQITTTTGEGAIVLCSCAGSAPIANIYSPSVQADMGTGEDAWVQTVGGWYYFGSQPENIVLGPFPMPTNSLPGVVAPIGDAGAPASQVFNWAQDPASGATVDLARPDSTSGATVDLATLGEMAVHPLLTMSGARDLDFKIYYDSTITGGNQYIASPSAGGCPYWTLYTPGDVGHWTHNFDGQAAYFPGSGGTSNMVVILLSHRRWTFIQNGSGYQPFDQSSAYDSLGANPDGSYTLTNIDQSTYTFSVTGSGTNLYLTHVTNPHGQALIIDRNSDNGQINTITEPVSGEYLSFTYGTAGNNFPAPIINISDSAGRTVSLSYDGNDMLTNVIEANDNSTSFTYDSNRHLVNEADAMGNLLLTISYNPDGTVASQTDARDNQYLYGYSMNTDANRNVISTVAYVTNRDSYVSIYQFDPNHNLISYTSPDLEQTTNSYDGNGNLLTTTDPLGKTTTYAYDDNGNVVAVTNALNYVTVMTYYDGTHNLWTITDPDDNTSTFTYDNNNNVLTTEDSLGHQVVRTYDGNSLLLTQTSPNGGVATYTYSGGLPASLEDAAGNIESMMYDDVGNLQTFTDAAGNSTVSKYGPLRELMEVDDAAGNKLVNTYDWRLRKSTITDFSGAVTSYGYDGNNNLVAVTNALNQVTTCGYDPENLPSSVTDPLGNKSSLGYDKDARLIETMDAMGDTASCTYDMDDDLASVTDSKGNIVVTNSYDACNELLSSQDALGHTTTCTYDPASVLASAKDPLGHVKSFIHDTLERTVTVDAPLSTTTMQGFDADGNCTSLTNANNNSTTFAFDSADRPMKTTTATGDSTTCSYNSRNLPSVITQPSGASVTYSYDSLGRITNTVDPVGSITYTYDPDGRVLATAETSSNVTKTISRQYDFLGRLKGFTDDASNVLQYAYYADGSLQTLTYPDGKQVNYGYDAARRLNSVTDWAGRVTKYMYDADSRVATITRPDNSSEIFSYYANGNISQSVDMTASQNIIHSIQYSYDNDDEITCEDATPAPGIYHPANFSFTVDADNRLATINGQPAVYDNNGNLTNAIIPGSAISALTYDARNRLISAGGLTYAYDAENRRTSISSSAGTTSYVINPNAGLSQVLVKTAPDGTMTRYVYGLGLISEETGSAFTTYHFDHRGSTTALTDINGNITQTFSYGPGGEPVGFSPAIAPTQFLYGGRYGVLTDTNGLCYMRARYYLPATGRFINQDTMLGNIASGTSLNRFAYGNGDPINKIDPLGLEEASADSSTADADETLEFAHIISEGLSLLLEKSAHFISEFEPAHELVKSRLQTPGLFQPFMLQLKIEDPITNPLTSAGLQALPGVETTATRLGLIAPGLQFFDAVMNEQQALTEFGEREPGLASLHGAQFSLNLGLSFVSATRAGSALGWGTTGSWVAEGGAVTFGGAALAAGVFGGMGIKAGIAAVKGTEQPVDAFDRMVQQHSGFNPSLGDLIAYPEAYARIRTEERQTFGARAGFGYDLYAPKF